MAESAPSEVKKNDPELFNGSLRKMTRFVAVHGRDYLTKDKDPSETPDTDGLVHLYGNPEDGDSGRRSDGRSVWMHIDPDSEGIDGTNGGEVEVLDEGPASRYDQFAKLYLTNSEQTIEHYYTFKSDGRVMLSEATIDYKASEDGVFTKGEPYQIDDEKLRELHTMLDYMQPDTEYRPAEGAPTA
jgi:hypothetical protein